MLSYTFAVVAYIKIEQFVSVHDWVSFCLFQSNPALAGVETNFRLCQMGQFILLEAAKESGKHVGVLPTGEIKSGLATGREEHAHFGARLIVSI